MGATIKDVAKYAGVSIATVSRVINNSSSVKPKTVEKVNEAIKVCRFVPNYVARNLKSEKSKTIGFLVSSIANPYFTVMAKVLETNLCKRGYDMLICSTDEDQNQESHYLNRLIGNQVAGIVLNTTGKNNKLIADLSQAVPIALIERRIETPKFRGDFIGSNNHTGIYTITEHLIENGHRKIGIINGNVGVSTGAERLKGFTEAMKMIGISVDEKYKYYFNAPYFNEENGYDGAKYLMDLPEPPTALIVSNNTMSIGALKYLKKHNYRIPEDISIMVYGNVENSELFFVEPSYVTLNPYSIGEKASHYILTRIENITSNNRETIFEPSLFMGKSVRSI